MQTVAIISLVDVVMSTALVRTFTRLLSLYCCCFAVLRFAIAAVVIGVVYFADVDVIGAFVVIIDSRTNCYSAFVFPGVCFASS